MRCILEPLLPQAPRLPEAVGLTTSEVQADELERAHDDGLVVSEVRTTEVSIQVGGEQIGVACCSKTGQGHAVGQPSAADFAGQQEFPEALTELGPAGDSYEPSRSSPLSPAAFKELGVDRLHQQSANRRLRSRFLSWVSRDIMGVGRFTCERTSAAGVRRRI